MRVRFDSDRRGNDYAELELPANEWFRITFLDPCTWGGPGVRLQIRPDGQPLRQGPEVPLPVIAGAFAATVELIS